MRKTTKELPLSVSSDLNTREETELITNNYTMLEHIESLLLLPSVIHGICVTLRPLPTATQEEAFVVDDGQRPHLHFKSWAKAAGAETT